MPHSTNSIEVSYTDLARAILPACREVCRAAGEMNPLHDLYMPEQTFLTKFPLAHVPEGTIYSHANTPLTIKISRGEPNEGAARVTLTMPSGMSWGVATVTLTHYSTTRRIPHNNPLLLSKVLALSAVWHAAMAQEADWLRWYCLIETAQERLAPEWLSHLFKTLLNTHWDIDLPAYMRVHPYCREPERAKADLLAQVTGLHAPLFDFVDKGTDAEVRHYASLTGHETLTPDVQWR